MADFKDLISDIAAEADTSKISRAQTLLNKYKVSNFPPDLIRLLEVGINYYVKQDDFWERTKQKILVMNPKHFDEIAERIKQKELTPAGIRATKEKEKREQIQKEKSERIHKMCVESANKLKDLCDTVEIAMQLYDTWKVGRKKLGDCTKEDLIRHSRREMLTAESHEENALFYSQLAAKLQARQKVREGIPLDKAHEIRAAVYVNK